VSPVDTRLEYALVALVGAGSAMLPDLDTQGLAARTFGWPTRVLAKGVAAVSGGHRKGTHSLLGIAVVGGIAWLAALLDGPGHWAAAVLALGLGVRALGFTAGGAINNAVTFAVCSAFVWFTVQHGATYDWVPLAYLVGAFSHVVADSATQHGCPWLYPFSKRTFRFAAVDTGEWVENLLVLPGTVLATVALAVWRLGWWPPIIHAAQTGIEGATAEMLPF
jgi:membrane-bound metal-dependent hydrolase YbcI (DUF457 family)